ncbi:MAG: LytTR family DNA-binding domain-containing protein [Saprospiraceae bacterium]
MIKCLIIDDDSMARLAMKRLCEKSEYLELRGECDGAESALAFLSDENEQVDLLFLDVEMPGISGIELLEQLPVVPMLIFTTSKADYAFDAFEYGAIDFLKKPITLPRFEQAVQKILSIQNDNLAFKDNSENLYVRTEGKYVRLTCDDILYFENVGDYIRIKTKSGESHIIHGTLKGIAERLNDPRFLKVHRTFIVNLDKIVDIEENTLVIDRNVIPISRAHKQILMNRLRIL